MNEKNMRAFIALELDSKLRELIGGLSERLEKGMRFSNLRASWVAPENLHLTLKFLGDGVPNDERHIADIRAAIEKSTRQAGPLNIRFNALGCFPNAKRPKVLFLGLRQKDLTPIVNIAHRIEYNLKALGYEPERREFKPHLTLARFPALRGAHVLSGMLASHQQFARFESTFDHISLIQSDLSSGAPVYTERARVDLIAPPTPEPSATEPPAPESPAAEPGEQ